MARVFASISVISFVLAAVLIASPRGAGERWVLARAFREPAPAATTAPLGCPGISVRGAHAGCFAFTQIVCRPGSLPAGEDQIVVDGVLAGTSAATIRLSPGQTRFTVTVSGAQITLLGGPPALFDVQRGADLDLDVGLAGTPAGSRLKGSIPCG